MLTEKESFPIHFFIRYNSMLGILPVTLSRINGRIRMKVEQNQVKIFVSKLVFFLALLDALYVGGRLVQTIINEEGKSQERFRERLALHVIIWTIANLSVITGWRTCFTHSNTNVTIFNSVFEEAAETEERIEETREEGEGADAQTDAVASVEEVKNSKDGYGRYLKPWTFSPLELPGLYMSIATLPCTLLFCVICLWDPERPHLLYTAIPVCCQNGYVFALLFALEAFLFNFGIAMVCYPMMLHNSVLQKVDLELKLLKEMLNDAKKGEDVKKIMTKLSRLSLLIHFLNESHAYNIFILKTIALIPLPIFCLFQAIIFFKENHIDNFHRLHYLKSA